MPALPEHVLVFGAHVLHRPASALHPAPPHADSSTSAPLAAQNAADESVQVRNAPGSHGQVASLLHFPMSVQLWPVGQSGSRVQVTTQSSGSEQPPFPTAAMHSAS
jgi:hypothetical protein